MILVLDCKRASNKTSPSPMYLLNFRTLNILSKRSARTMRRLWAPGIIKLRYVGIIAIKSMIPKKEVAYF